MYKMNPPAFSNQSFSSELKNTEDDFNDYFLVSLKDGTWLVPFQMNKGEVNSLYTVNVLECFLWEPRNPGQFDCVCSRFLKDFALTSLWCLYK